MKRGGLGILIILIVALLVAFLLTSQMAGKKSVNMREEAVQAAQSAADAANAANAGLQNTIAAIEGGA